MADLLRVTIKGSMPSGEEWSINPVWSIGGDFGAPVSSTQANTIAVAIAGVTVPAALLASVASSCNVSGARVEARDVDGSLESIGEAVKGTPTPGGSTASPKTFQSSVVISLRTAHAGASGRGRLYWPGTGATTTNATLRLASTTVDTYLAGAKTYLSGIQAAIDVTLDGVALAVWSRKNADLYVVNQLQMGDVLDTQRRRRDAAVETYSTVVFP